MASITWSKETLANKYCVKKGDSYEKAKKAC